MEPNEALNGYFNSSALIKGQLGCLGEAALTFGTPSLTMWKEAETCCWGTFHLSFCAAWPGRVSNHQEARFIG